MARMLVWLGTGLFVAAACSSRPEESREPSSQRTRDSVLGASNLPGARGVRGALGASDSAAVRNATLDSLANQP